MPTCLQNHELVKRCKRSGRHSSVPFVTGCEILPVSQWGDDQARRVSQVLIAIANGSIDHPDHHIIILPVVPEARVHLFSCC
jgi:hypothetical protein